MSILLVEDSPTQGLILETQLKQRGCHVKTALNGDEALECLKEFSPTIIVSDVVMPGMNGYELCRIIKSNPDYQHIPVLLLTSLFDPVDVIRAIECGADSFLVKPCPKDLLHFHIENVLENRKIEQDLTNQSTFDFYFGGVHYKLPKNPVQITYLLLSTYSSATARNLEYHEEHHDLNLLKSVVEAKNDELERAKQQKNQLMKISQEYLKPSFISVRGDCTFLLNKYTDKLDKEAISALARLKETSDDMLSLINEFMDVSAVESLDIRLNLRQQDVAAIVKQNMILNEKLAEKRNIKLVLAVSDNLPKAYIDSYKFEQVLNILISNAMAVSPSGSTVEITLVRASSELVLTVKDQGEGISPGQADKLFGLYERFSRKGSADETSSGLSLAIAKNIISEHHGRIWVESPEGKGATFCIALPIAD